MASSEAVSLSTRAQSVWIHGKRWDLTFLIFSAVLVPLPFALAWTAERLGGAGAAGAIAIVNVAVAALVGGPHLFSTFTLTLLNRSFLREHRAYAAGAAVLPIAVVYFGLTHYPLLIQVFFAWASLHVLHQIVYISDCYRRRVNRFEPLWSRLIDYGVILTGLYPIGLEKIATSHFRVGGVVLQYPAWARPLHLPAVAGALFGLLLAAWVVKSVREYAAGLLSVPKTLLIAVTSVVSFFLPLGSNLDVLFQGYNTWHSFQYLFLLWLINRLRYVRGEIDSPLVRYIVRSGSIAPYYLSFLAATAALVALTLIVRAATTLSADQSYFIVVLSVLLVHYYFDHFLFTKVDLLSQA